MSDLLAVVGSADADEELVEEIARRRPDRVTVLVEDDDRPAAPRGQIAALIRAIEESSGAAVVGLVRSRSQLRGWRFDREVHAGTPVPARTPVPV
jgi:hypothetical protein